MSPIPPGADAPDATVPEPLAPLPRFDRRILDRQIGRNAQLFAEAVGALETPEARFPYVRILTALVETAHPEWAQAPQKETLISDLVTALSGGTVDAAEVADVVRVRDEERGITTG